MQPLIVNHALEPSNKVTSATTNVATSATSNVGPWSQKGGPWSQFWDWSQIWNLGTGPGDRFCHLCSYPLDCLCNNEWMNEWMNERKIKYSFTSRPSASIFNLLLPLNLKMSLFTLNQSFSNHHAKNLERLSKWEEEAGCRHGYDDKFHDLVGFINYQIHSIKYRCAGEGPAYPQSPC